jgi:hypothetical protein
MCCETFKKVAKIIGIIAAIAAAATAVYFAVTKFIEIKGRDDEAEDYVSCHAAMTSQFLLRTKSKNNHQKR